MADMILLNSEVEYTLVDRVCRAYQKIKGNPGAYDLAESMMHDEKSVVDAIANHAKDLNLEGASAAHISKAMELTKHFAGGDVSKIDALNILSSDREAYGRFQVSQNAFYARQDELGKTILDSRKEYANLVKLVNAYGDVSGRMSDFGLTPSSSGEDWKNALKNYAGLNMTPAEFEKAYLNAGKVLADRQTGVNALETLYQGNDPIISSYKRFSAQKGAELEGLGKKRDVSKKDYADSKKANRKAKRTVLGTILGQAAMLLAIPASIGGLFAGAAALAGSVAALTSVASVGIVLTTGLVGLVGFTILKKPFMKLLTFLGGKRAAARALLDGDENTLGSRKNRKKMKGLFKSNSKGYEKFNAKLNKLAKSDEEVLSKLVENQPIRLENSEGLSLENRERVAMRQAIVPEREAAVKNVESTPVEEHEAGREPSKDTINIEEKRTTHNAIEERRANTFFNVGRNETPEVIEKGIDAYVEKLCEDYKKANPGKGISEAEKTRIKNEALVAYNDYFEYKDRKVVSKLARDKRKAKEIAKLVDTELYVAVEDEHKNISSAAITINAEELANQVNITAQKFAEVNIEERKIRSDMQETYNKAMGGSEIAREVVDEHLKKIAQAKGVDYASLKAYYDAELSGDRRYSHAGVVKTAKDKDGKTVELSNKELLELSKDIAPIVELGKQTDEKLNKIDEDRKAVKKAGGAYEGYVSDKVVEGAIDKVVDEQFASLKPEQKKQLKKDLKTYYTAEKPYEEGKVEVATMKGIVSKAGADESAVKDAIADHIKASVKNSVDEMKALNLDKQHMEELNKFHKECAAVGLDSPDGIIAEFLKKVDTDVALQKKLGKDKVAQLKAIVAKNPKVADDVEKYAKTIPGGKRAQEAKVGELVGGSALDNQELRYIIDVCYDDYKPYRDQQRQEKAEEIRLQQEREEAERQAQREKAKQERLAKKDARKQKRAAGKKEEVHEKQPGSEE